MSAVQRIGKLAWQLLLISFLTISCADHNVSQTFPESTSKPNPDNSVNECSHFSRIENKFLVTWSDGHITTETELSTEIFIEKFLKPQHSKIKFVEYDKMILLKKIFNQPSLSLNQNMLASWGQKSSHAKEVWDEGFFGQNISVGIVDAAIDYSHPQIMPRLKINSIEFNGAEGVDDDGNGFVDDVYGWDFLQNKPDPANIISTSNDHGTHVAGIIAADPSNGPIFGMAPKSNIIPANFMGADGSGTLSGAIEAIKYVVNRGARIVNMSWGGPICSMTLKNVMSTVGDGKILFIAASGNDGLNLDTTSDFPASFNLENQINVAAIAFSEIMTSWSNSSFKIVHIAAPGDSILSTVPKGYRYMSGTSMAAPFVSGAAALLMSAAPTATIQQIRSALLAGVETNILAPYKASSGGRLQVKKALEELKKQIH